MKKLLMTICIMMIMKNNHPMFNLMLILMLSLILSISLFLKTHSYWLMFLIIITFIGGLMIIFMYVISLSSNEENFSSPYPIIYLSLIMVILQSNPLSVMSTSLSMSYSINFLSVILMSIMIFMMIQLSSKLIVTPFKNLKSTF